MLRGVRGPVAAILLVPLLLSGCGRDSDRPLTIFAAASLTDALTNALAAWETAGHPAPRVSFAASSTLARQIEEGAPADLFVSANEAWMDRLERAGRLVAGTRVDLLGNDLVLIAPRDSGLAPDLSDGAALARAFRGRLALADPDGVPAGIYAKQALAAIGAWPLLKDRLAAAPNVRGALAFVSRGECAAGVVYGTDAGIDPGVKVVGRFPPATHDPIRYPAAAVTGGRMEAAAALLAWLQSAEAGRIFARAGFRVLAETVR